MILTETTIFVNSKLKDIVKKDEEIKKAPKRAFF